MAMIGLGCAAKKDSDMAKIYDFKTTGNKGAEVDFAQFEGKVLLIVNTASKCGFTPQYDGLEALYQKYKDRGLVIIGFPCDQFAGQEPGSNEQIEEFCRLNHGVTFPLKRRQRRAHLRVPEGEGTQGGIQGIQGKGHPEAPEGHQQERGEGQRHPLEFH